MRRLTKLDLIKWKNDLLKEKKGNKFVRVPRTVRDVHLAVVRAACQFLVDELELYAASRTERRKTTTTRDSPTKNVENLEGSVRSRSREGAAGACDASSVAPSPDARPSNNQARD
jgi:hypothetical protein